MNEESTCLLCKKKVGRGLMFCKSCKSKDIFAKIKVFKKSQYFKYGWKTKRKINHSRLPTREERYKNE